MRKPENGLASLFQQYLAGTLDPGQHAQFLQLVAEDHSEEALKALIEEEIARLESTGDMENHVLTEAQAAIIFDHIIAAKDRPGYFRRNRLVMMAGLTAAASVLLFAGIYYFQSSVPKKAPVTTAVVIHDASPAATGAVLTLADGTRMLLDTMQNGHIGQEGAAAITKGKEGIAYSSAGIIPKDKVVNNTLSTPRAYQYKLTLPDGTKVWLNAASSITYPPAFVGKERVVTVTGETYFEVVENKQQPFIVLYGDKRLEVVGTHFNVNAYNEETDSRVTLLEGAVRVQNGNTTGVLQPGQQAILSNTSKAVRITKEVDTDQVMAWKNGHFDFRETDLKTLMRELMRWYDVEVVYQEGVPERYFTADISRNKNLSAVLDILSLNKIHFKIENRKIIVTK